MHVGDTVSTEYNLDARFMDFLEEDFEERCTWSVGHIHSHHCMKTYFSGVDNEELWENSNSHNYYLSFITNNYLDFEAKVAFTSTAKKQISKVPYTALDEEGKPYQIEVSDFEVDEKKVFVYDCEIFSDAPSIEVSETFLTQVKGIKEEAEKRAKVAPKFTPPVSRNLTQANPPFGVSNLFPPNFNPFEENLNIDVDTDTDNLYEKITIELVKKMYNIGNFALTDETVDDVLDFLVESNLSNVEIAQHVITNYAENYNTIYNEAGRISELESTLFVSNTYTIIDFLEEYCPYYPEIKLSVKMLNNMLEKFITTQNENTSTNKPV